MRRRGAVRGPLAPRGPQSLWHGSRRHRARQPGQPAIADAGGAGPAGPRRARRAVPRPAQSQTRDLPVHGRRAVADGDVRLQAGAESAQRRTAAGFGPPGAAAHRHVGQPGVAAARRVAVRVQPSRCQRHLGQRSAATHRQGRRRPLHRPLDVHGGHQPRSGDHVLPERIADRRPPEHGRVGALRARQRQRGSAGVRRADHAGQGRPAAVRAAVGQRLPAERAPGRAVQERQGCGAVSRQP